MLSRENHEYGILDRLPMALDETSETVMT